MLCSQHTMGLAIKQSSDRQSQLLLCCHCQTRCQPADILSIARVCKAMLEMLPEHIRSLY